MKSGGGVAARFRPDTKSGGRGCCPLQARYEKQGGGGMLSIVCVCVCVCVCVAVCFVYVRVRVLCVNIHVHVWYVMCV